MRQQATFVSQSRGPVRRDFEGETFDIEGEGAARLKWVGPTTDVVVSGSSDYAQLNALKNALLLLKQDFFASPSHIHIQGEKRDDLDRRLILLEHEIDGLLRRRIEFSVKDANGSRNLDLTNLLNEKEN